MTLSRTGPILLFDINNVLIDREKLSKRALKIAALLTKLEDEKFFGSVKVNLGGEIKTVQTSQEIVI